MKIVWYAAVFALLAQQQVPFRNNIPVAPTGLADRPLPKLPMEFDTAEGQRIRVVAVTKGLTYPWSLAFLPDGALLVTERTGKLRVIRNGVLDLQPVAGIPASRYAGKSGDPGAVHGLMDIALHPRFAENQWVYFTYTKPLEGTRSANTIGRGRWDGKSLVDVRDIFVAEPGTGAARIAFGRDGTIFMTNGGNANDPQDPKNHGGKVLRIRDDGSVPPDNPFVGRDGYKPQIYSMGHRTSLGLAIHPGTGEVWQNENGPNGGDEINIIKPGRNYGWPLVTFGRDYDGTTISDTTSRPDLEPPFIYFVPSLATSGITFYTGDRFPQWKGNAFIGAMVEGRTSGTGHVRRITFNEQGQPIQREPILAELHQRIRDVRQGPDGYLYVLTDEDAGAVLRVEPAQ